MNIFLLVPMVYSCFLSFVLIISFLQVQVGGKELGTGKADSSGICRSPTSPASTLARPALQASRPRLGAPAVAGQLPPAPAWGLAARTGSRRAPRLPEGALGPVLQGLAWDRFPAEVRAAGRSSLLVARRDGLAGLRIRRIPPGR